MITQGNQTYQGTHTCCSKYMEHGNSHVIQVSTVNFTFVSGDFLVDVVKASGEPTLNPGVSPVSSSSAWEENLAHP